MAGVPRDGVTEDAGAGRMRADKWLCFARFLKTRALAGALIDAGHLRVNGARAARAAHPLGVGDVLTFPQGARIRVIRILALPARRGPAPEARECYEDLAPPPDGGGQTPGTGESPHAG